MSSEKRQPSRLIFRSPTKPAPKTELGASEEENRLRAAREKAAEYRNPQALPVDKSVDKDDKPQTMEGWSDLVSQRIEEAMRRGDFDKLPGQGKPLRVDPDPFVPADQQMSFKLLKNNDMTPTWIADRKEMLRTIENWREQFQRIAGEAYSAWVAAGNDSRRVQLKQSWARWIARWENEIIDLNRRINTINLKQPITHLEIYKLRLDDELRKVGMMRTLEK